MFGIKNRWSCVFSADFLSSRSEVRESLRSFLDLCDRVRQFSNARVPVKGLTEMQS